MTSGKADAISLLEQAEKAIDLAVGKMREDSKVCACGSRRWADHHEHLAAEAMRGIKTKIQTVRKKLTAQVSKENP